MTEPLSLRINSDLKAKLVAMADKDHRSLNNLIEKILLEYLEVKK